MKRKSVELVVLIVVLLAGLWIFVALFGALKCLLQFVLSLFWTATNRCEAVSFVWFVEAHTQLRNKRKFWQRDMCMTGSFLSSIPLPALFRGVISPFCLIFIYIFGEEI